MSKEKLIDLEHEQLGLVKVIIRRHIPGKTVWAYGSRVTWKASDISDLDLAVFGCSSAEVGDLKEAFEESSLLVSVGVMDWESSPEKFAESIGQRYVVVQRGLKGWREVKLGDIGVFKGGVTSIKKEDYGYGTPFITYKNIYKNTKIALDELVLMNVPKKDLEKCSGKYGDIFFTASSETDDEVAMSSVLLSNVKNLTFNGFSKRFRLKDFTSLLPLYGRYLFRSPIFRNAIKQRVTGDIRFNISQASLIEIALPLPPISKQEAIAEVLSSLDDKIDLLHRQNKTLEDMAQTLFRKWFVEEADEGWEEKSLDKIANYLNGLACQKYPPHNETDRLPVLKIKDLRNGIDENSDWVASEVKGEYIVNRGDIIFSWSGSLMIKLWDGVKCVLNQHLFKVSSTKYPKWYIYLWTKHHIDKFIQIAESKATTMGHIKRGDISNSMALVPTSEELPEMDGVVSPLVESMIHNFKQLHTLKNLRDTLLPKLISGDVGTRN